MIHLKSGATVEWTYKHHLNRKSFTYITKTGIVQEITGKVKSVRYVSGSHAKVLFKGNKHASIVPIKELKLIENV
jgi:hypothetical protein